MQKNNTICILESPCPFKSSECHCQLANNRCTYLKKEENTLNKHIRKERWYEKYYK